MSAQAIHLPTRLIPRFHSEVRYEIQPEERDAVLHISAYYRRDDALSVIWFPARTHTNILTSTLPIDSRPTAALGELDQLPLELVQKICLELDMKSLFCFRQVNARARQTLNALHEYRIITTHAIDAFYALLRTGTAPAFTLLDFYRLLCKQTCSVCKSRYGNTVHLLLWIRCCPVCLIKNPIGIQVSTLDSVEKVLNLRKTLLMELPTLTTIPGIYSRWESERKLRMPMVSTTSALSAYRKQHAGVEASLDMIDILDTEPMFTYMACCAIPSFDVQIQQAQNGVYCAGCQVAVEENIVTFEDSWTQDDLIIVYSRDGFLEHFERCEQAQLLWISSNCGIRQPPKLPEICQRGGYITRD